MLTLPGLCAPALPASHTEAPSPGHSSAPSSEPATPESSRTTIKCHGNYVPCNSHHMCGNYVVTGVALASSVALDKSQHPFGPQLGICGIGTRLLPIRPRDSVGINESVTLGVFRGCGSE